MATDKSDNPTSDSPSSKKSADGMSMKERLLAQRKAAEGQVAKPASAPPVPAARPVPRPSAAPTPAPTPAPIRTPTPKPTPTIAKSAAAVEAPEKRPVKLSGARADRGGKKPVSEDVRREIELLRKSQDKWITYGWIIALALLLIGGVTWFINKGKKDAIEEAERLRKESIATWVSTIKAFDLQNPADQQKFEAMIKDPANERLWKTNTHDSNSITLRIVSTIQKNKQDDEQIRDIIKGIDELESTAAGAASKSSEELEKARRRVALYAGQPGLAIEHTQRIAKAGIAIDRAYVAKLHDEAKASAAKGPGEMKNTLAAFTKAEDEIIKSLDDAYKKKDEERKTYYTEHLQAIIPESDAVVASAFTPEVVEKTAWLDLLSSPGKDGWQNVGFTGWQLKDGVLTGLTDLGAKATAVMSVGDKEQWRDYVLEVEFVVTKGDPKLHARLGANINNTTINYDVGTTGQNAFKPGATNTITVTVIGSTAKIAFSDPDRTASEDPLSWTIARKGGIGFSVPPGGEIKITKMRIKVLR